MVGSHSPAAYIQTMGTSEIRVSAKEWQALPLKFCLISIAYFALTDLLGGQLIDADSNVLQSWTIGLRCIQMVGLLGIIHYFGLAPSLGWQRPDVKSLRVFIFAGFCSVAGALLLLAIWPEFRGNLQLQAYLHGPAGMLLMFVFAPVVEEILFRGVLYRLFRSAFGVSVAVVMSAMLFSMMHGSILAPQLAGGLIFALAYEWSRNLFVPIALHAGGNVLIWSGWLTAY